MKTIDILGRFHVLQLFLLLLLIIVGTDSGNAQSFLLRNDYDTNYIYSATEKLTTRVFSSVSYTDVTIHDRNLKSNLSYSIHSKLHFGVGFNYSVFGFNFSMSPFKNTTNDDKYGKTQSLDLRMNLYGRSLIFDLYLISHSGFYLSNPGSILEGWTDKDTYPLRPDIHVFSAGLVTQYILRNKKFSLRATYLQNEWQKKSAGSFIVGASFFYLQYNADSSFIPDNIKYPDFIEGYKFNYSSSLNFGLNAGYSHTFVLKQHFFLSMGLSLGPQFGYSVLGSEDINQATKSAFTVGLDGLLRVGTGYNSKKIYAGVFFISENLAHTISVSDAGSILSIGIVKLNFVYRFTLKKPIKFLNPNYWKFIQHKDGEK